MNILTPATEPWVKTGIVAGFAASIVYPLMIAVPMPHLVTVTLACAFGPLFLVALYGLHRILLAHRESVAARLSPLFAVGAGTLITGMLTVQMATSSVWQKAKDAAAGDADKAVANAIGRMVWSVNLGLDVAWDVFIGLATLCVAIAMFRHPWFGRVLGLSGILVAVLLLALNLATFPTPPGDAGLFDMGPFTGVWYLAVTINLMIRYRRAAGAARSGSVVDRA